MQETTTIKTAVFFENALADLKIDVNRIELLKSIAVYIANEMKAQRNVNLNYICTHNSRKSQIAQVWSSYATAYFKFTGINSFSGGTAITSFYRNTVKTLQEVGFTFQIVEFSHQNPVYSINYKNGMNPIIGFSKFYSDLHNKSPFIAITTCNTANEYCPFIPEAIQRFHIPFQDPKPYDNTHIQSEKYLEVNKQIAGEIHYIFKMIKGFV